MRDAALDVRSRRRAPAPSKSVPVEQHPRAMDDRDEDAGIDNPGPTFDDLRRSLSQDSHNSHLQPEGTEATRHSSPVSDAAPGRRSSTGSDTDTEDPLSETEVDDNYVAPNFKTRKTLGKNIYCRTYFVTADFVVAAPPFQLQPSMEVVQGRQEFVFYVHDHPANEETSIWIYERRGANITNMWYSIEPGAKRVILGRQYYLSVQRYKAKKLVRWVSRFTYNQHRRKDSS